MTSSARASIHNVRYHPGVYNASTNDYRYQTRVAETPNHEDTYRLEARHLQFSDDVAEQKKATVQNGNGTTIKTVASNEALCINLRTEHNLKLLQVDKILPLLVKARVIAFICGVICTILLIVAIASTEWLTADGIRSGLWVECQWKVVNNVTCTNTTRKAWIEACGALMIISLIFSLVGSVLTATALVLKNHDTKFKLYRIAMYLMFLALFCVLVSVIVFPAMFVQEIRDRGKTYWEFAWAYGFAWGAAIFCTGAAFMLLCDKESDEIYYREKISYPSQTSLEAR